MDAETREALEASIEKWMRNAEAARPSEARISASDCPLCDMFLLADCRGCPIADRTGRNDCGATPYGRAASARYRWLIDPKHRDAFHAAAREEVAFLESLRPEEP